MITLGIESTAHTFGIGIATGKGRILANVKDTFTTKKGGIIPHQAAEHHVNIFGTVLSSALQDAGIQIQDVDLIAYSQSPGLGPCLRIGAAAARSLALIHGKPIIGVNHCIAHLEIGRLLCKCKDPILLYASGANTQIIAYESGRYRIFGETLDIGIGNFLDTFARHMGLGFPGGPKIYELSMKGKNLIELPYIVKGMDVSFGGLLTNLKQKFDSGKYSREDLCFSLQETAYAMLLEVTERAMAHCAKKEVVLGGGVACNKRLQEMAQKMCEARGAKCFVPPNEFLVDNGAMIAWLGWLTYKSGRRLEVEKADIDAYLRTDEVEVDWR